MKQFMHFVKKFQLFAGKILYINLIGMAFISLLDGLGIFLLIPILNLSGIGGSGNSQTNLFGLFDSFHSMPIVISLPLILCLYIFLVIGQNIIQRNMTIRNVRIHQGYVHHLRLEIYNMLLHANWAFFIKKKKTDLINSLTSDIGRVSTGINLFIQLISTIIFTLIQIILALMLSTRMTIFVLICGFILALFSRKFIKKSRNLGSQTSELSQNYLSGITDQLNGIKDIKSNNLEESRLTWLNSLIGRMKVEQDEYIKLKTASQLSYQISSAILIAFFIFFTLKMFHSDPKELLLVIVIFSRLWPRFTALQSNLEQIAATIPAFHSLILLQKECNESQEVEFGNIFGSKIKPIDINQGIECKNIYFKYNEKQKNYALKDVNIKIPINKMTAICGRSGAGKSTLIDILMGLLKPERGNVLLDGIPLTGANLISLRKSISYVSQDPFLFNESIRKNLLNVDPNANEEAIWQALEFSASAEFVKNLPKGIDTVIGDRGVKLSGGERQRLVLARAILRKPSILILDEATSALDSENESKIQEALEQIRGSMTIIVIAHRLSTIRNADQVIVLDQGEVIQKGEYDQLTKEKRGMFSHLLRKQLGTSGL